MSVVVFALVVITGSSLSSADDCFAVAVVVSVFCYAKKIIKERRKKLIGVVQHISYVNISKGRRKKIA